jgi:hypothetical protein
LRSLLWLNPTIDTRIKELGRGTFSLHAIETVCFSRRIRRNHAVTGQFARDMPALQDAIDRFITTNYRPGMERNGGTARNAWLREIEKKIRALAIHEDVSTTMI